MASTGLSRSQVVTNLAALASKGVYQVDPAGARNMNTLFTFVAELINELEAEEALAAKLDDAQALQAEELAFEDEGGT